MRKKFLLLTFLIVSCGYKRNEQVQIKDEIVFQNLDYIDFNDSFINWSQLFSFENEYLVYVFSYSCKHCQTIKKEALNYFKNISYKVYLVEYSKEILIGSNPSETIGMTNYKNVFIGGTPSLINIFKKEVKSNICGDKQIIEYLKYLYSLN